MILSQYFFLISIAVFLLSSAYHWIRVIRSSHLDDFTQPKGTIIPAFLYSVSGAMMPHKKETAYLHLPTYSLGIIYHLGSFLALAFLPVHFFRWNLPGLIFLLGGLFVLVSALAGLFILFKRFWVPTLRHLSAPDDYFSNFLVTAFQILTALCLLDIVPENIVLITAGLVFLYIPVGKLRHVIFFVIARFYLGWFYGRRGVWPPKRRTLW